MANPYSSGLTNTNRAWKSGQIRAFQMCPTGELVTVPLNSQLNPVNPYATGVTAPAMPPKTFRLTSSGDLLQNKPISAPQYAATRNWPVLPRAHPEFTNYPYFGRRPDGQISNVHVRQKYHDQRAEIALLRSQLQATKAEINQNLWTLREQWEREHQDVVGDRDKLRQELQGAKQRLQETQEISAGDTRKDDEIQMLREKLKEMWAERQRLQKELNMRQG